MLAGYSEQNNIGRKKSKNGLLMRTSFVSTRNKNGQNVIRINRSLENLQDVVTVYLKPLKISTEIVGRGICVVEILKINWTETKYQDT